MSSRQLFIGATGIYVSYLSIALLFQHVYLHKYPSILPNAKPQRFNHPALTVWLGALFCAIFGFIRAKVTKQPPNPISRKEQIYLGLLFTANIIGAQYSLVYVSYLTKVIGGNFRYLLVVLIGVYLSRVKKEDELKLPRSKVVIAVIITVGVIMFTLFKDEGKKKGSAFNPQTQWIGYLCILVSIVSDSFFTDFQAYSKMMFKPTANHLFTSANFFTFFFVFVLVSLQGQLALQIKFCAYHPTVIPDLIASACLQVMGQASIYYVISNFKQHMFPLISTTRKVLTVFLSILVYGHSVNLGQWVSIFFVFGGLAYEVVEEVKEKKANDKQNQRMLDQKKDE